MTTITPGTGDNRYADFGFSSARPRSGDALGQADFLRLMTEQLKNQDPLKPLENAQFLGQLAQFSTVQGIEQMQSAMNAMASIMESDQSLRAVALVGREALVEVSSVELAAGAGAHGEVVATRAGSVKLEVVDASGAVVRRISLQATGAGHLPFAWDGKDEAGRTMPAGRYSLRAVADDGTGAESLALRLSARVESVSIEPQGLVLNLAGLGSHPLSAVRRLG